MNLEYKKGELIALSKGEYDDYQVESFSRALVDFDANKVFSDWAKDNAVYEKHVYTNKFCYKEKRGCMTFVDWLVKGGYIESLDYKELHTGDYYNVELTDYKL